MGSTFFKVKAIGLPDVKSHVRRSNALCSAESSEINVTDSPLADGDLDHAAMSVRIHSVGGATGWEQVTQS